MKNFLGAAVVAASIFSLASAQDHLKAVEDETRRDLPALRAFHSVMHPLWHGAWPEKDVRMLIELLPEAEKLGADLIRAELPGILREKAEKWKTQIAAFEASLIAYRAAASPPDTVRLLNAVEDLHSQYEKLVRILRPVLKEIDDFHVTLYVLYHYHLPAGDAEAIRTSVAELGGKMKALNAAELPARVRAREAEFRAAREALAASVEELVHAVSAGEMGQIHERIEAMHTRYQELEELFN